MSELTKWIDNKKINILDDFCLFCSDESVKERLSSMFVYPIICKFLSYGNDETKEWENRQYDDPNDLLHCFRVYQDIIADINMKMLFVPSLENFSMFMGWSATQLKYVATNTSYDTMAVMDLVEDYLVESQFSAGQAGLIKANLTKFRTQVAGNHGQNLVTQKEENENNRSKDKGMTKEELEKQLNNITGKTQFLVDK